MIAYPRHGRDGLRLDKRPRPENGMFLDAVNQAVFACFGMP